jgi:hypothetical protein
MDVVEADAFVIAEGETVMRKRRAAARDLSMAAPPGSKAMARTQGLPRNLGGLVAFRCNRERPREGKRARSGQREVGAPQ